MKNRLILLALLGLGTSSALAADMAARPYAKAPVAAPVAYAGWSKCYVGISGGYIATANSHNTAITANDAGLGLSQALGNVPTTLSSDPDGGIIGGQVGCNWQT